MIDLIKLAHDLFILLKAELDVRHHLLLRSFLLGRDFLIVKAKSFDFFKFLLFDCVFIVTVPTQNVILHSQILLILRFLRIDFFVVILVKWYDDDCFFLFFNRFERRCLIRRSLRSNWFSTGVRAADRPLTLPVIRDGQSIEMLLLLRLPSFLLVILLTSLALSVAFRHLFLLFLHKLCFFVLVLHPL